MSLAASLALARNTPDPVLFLEANIYNPSAGLYLGAGEGPGMLDVLDGRADIQDALYRLERPDLTVFLAGNGDDAEPGMLAKPKFHAALEKASAQFPTVIMDGPCILEHPDACGLMSYATEVILVARANHGRRRDIQAALDILMSSRIEPTGVFFNDFR
ncbi:MAG: Mrp family chromosome partitioning ATPase [Planctomycetota bacterium]